MKTELLVQMDGLRGGKAGEQARFPKGRHTC